MEAESLVSLYKDGKSLAELGKLFRVGVYVVKKRLLYNGIPIRRRGAEKGCIGKKGTTCSFYMGGERVSFREARDVVYKAVRKGLLVQKPCEVCGEFGKTRDGFLNVEAHHDDYNFPLQVRWLCRKHHFEWHKCNKPIQKFHRNER